VNVRFYLIYTGARTHGMTVSPEMDALLHECVSYPRYERTYERRTGINISDDGEANNSCSKVRYHGGGAIVYTNPPTSRFQWS
jgi:hypothetical protein